MYNDFSFKPYVKELVDKFSNYPGSIKTLVYQNGYCDGGGITIIFDNMYGLDAIINEMSYGHDVGFYEIAIMDINPDTLAPIAINYTNPITKEHNGVIGFLDLDEVEEYIKKVKNLQFFAKKDAQSLVEPYELAYLIHI